MRPAGILLLTLLLGAALASAVGDDGMDGHDGQQYGSFGPPATCGPEGLPGGWSKIEGGVADNVLEAVLQELDAAYGAVWGSRAAKLVLRGG
jgi:hypothetical protein